MFRVICIYIPLRQDVLIAKSENYHKINCRPILLPNLSKRKHVKISNKKTSKMGVLERDSTCIKE
jgi:GH43 family beta-xylosidase